MTALITFITKDPIKAKGIPCVFQVFRHGDHTPQEFFPTDKHKEAGRQQGYGQLTKVCLLTWANTLNYWNVVC